MSRGSSWRVAQVKVKWCVMTAAGRAVTPVGGSQTSMGCRCLRPSAWQTWSGRYGTVRAGHFVAWLHMMCNCCVGLLAPAL
jgi:hypothetical protein